MDEDGYKYVKLFLEPFVQDLKTRTKIDLNNIQFVLSKPIFVQASIPHLLVLYKVLKENTSLRIEIAGHTDDLGPKNMLMDLSVRRALKIKDFLVSRGIHTSRIKTKGYGDTMPLNQ